MPEIHQEAEESPEEKDFQPQEEEMLNSMVDDLKLNGSIESDICKVNYYVLSTANK